MTSSKIVEEIIVDLDFPKNKNKRILFVVFSSKEPHNEIVIDNIERIMGDKYGFDIVRLDEVLKSDDSQYMALSKYLSTCTLAIVILDGFRPNVLFEYGILKGLNKPSIVLLEADATVDIKSFYESECSIPNPKIDIDKHFSDIKDRYYVRYNKLDPKGLRETIKKEYRKLKKHIEEEFIRTIFPNKEDVVNELRVELTALSNIYLKDEKDLVISDEENLKQIAGRIEAISAKNSIVLPVSYYFTIARIYEALNKDNYALEIIAPQIKKSKRIGKLLVFKAYLLKKLNRPEQALKVIEEAISDQRKRETLWHNKALLLEQLGRKKEAFKAYKIGVSFNKGCSTIHLHLGIMFYEAKKPKEALIQFERALTLQPDNSNYLLWKGKALYKLKNRASAFEIVQKAVSLKPGDANSWFTLGIWEKDESKAITFYNNAIRANPNHYGALCSKGAALSNSGKFNEAFEILWAMRDKCSRQKNVICSTLASNLLTTISKMKKKPSDTQMLELFAMVKSSNPVIMGLKATALVRQGKFGRAVKLFKSALQKSPNSAFVWYNLACTYALMQDKKNLIFALKKAILLDQKKAIEALVDKDFKGVLSDQKFQEVVNVGRRSNLLLKK